MNTLPPGGAGRIVHLEDEPEIIHAQILAAGLRLGTEVRVLEKSEKGVRFLADGTEHVIAPILAQNIDVIPLPVGADAKAEASLGDLNPGAKAMVLGLASDCRGTERRRLLDLGFVPGTVVEMEMASPTGDPTAYRVRGTVIALRREQARLVRVALVVAEAK